MPPDAAPRRVPAGPRGHNPWVLGWEGPKGAGVPRTCGFAGLLPAGSRAGGAPESLLAENLREMTSQSRRFLGAKARGGTHRGEPAEQGPKCRFSGRDASGCRARREPALNGHHSACRFSARHSLEVPFSENLRVSSAVSRGFSAGRPAGTPLSREPADATGCSLQALEGRATQAAPRRRTRGPHPSATAGGRMAWGGHRTDPGCHLPSGAGALDARLCYTRPGNLPPPT